MTAMDAHVAAAAESDLERWLIPAGPAVVHHQGLARETLAGSVDHTLIMRLSSRHAGSEPNASKRDRDASVL